MLDSKLSDNYRSVFDGWRLISTVMSTMLHLFVDNIDDRPIRISLGLVGEDPVEQLRMKHDVNVSRAERRDALRAVDSVAVGSTRYEFARQFPDALGAPRPVVIDDAAISAVRELARSVELDAKQNAYNTPQPQDVLAFMQKHVGEQVFTASVRFERGGGGGQNRTDSKDL